MSPVVQALSANPMIESTVCVTAQHRQMLDQVLQVFNVKPDIDLNLMQPNQTLSQISAEIFTNLDNVVKKTKPDWILIQGDTTTVAIAAIVGYYNLVKIGHIEAGLRSFNKWAPFPEEVNRRIAGVIADLHFAPTEGNKRNLMNEGIPDTKILVTGNPAIDALKQITSKSEPKEILELITKHHIHQDSKRLVLITAHRRENFGKPLLNICEALKILAHRFEDDVVFIYPVHLNPNIQKPVYEELGNIQNILLLPPLDYLPMAHLMKYATVILTDSGGLQEEAPALGIPTLVLRETTERPEGVEAGTLKLVGNNTKVIVEETSKLLESLEAHAAMANAVNPFGDGFAAERIVNGLLNFAN
jgi:UDP-N-acetylglucosamine 2-epimerase (non-hydrolysing)